MGRAETGSDYCSQAGLKHTVLLQPLNRVLDFC